ncbi:Protease inhibitor seed storage LTP family protein precursor [Musa troglodytarum]|uniref:Protease inhibitor seed storage LTP family protein n=1 Tax=Musa troglodytarum TaxID=320322 RepID=A0A9E7F1U6_9LILI|nr:Protease inhibitor seed storage LTP family protein precursor [Musa troglodytarum]
MAKKAFQVGLALAVMTIVLSGLASAQSGCTTAIISLAPCLSYITGNSSAPSSSCCSQLASVVKSEPACLCSVLNGGASSFGITVNQTRALAMPAACKVQTPPVSDCGRWTGEIPDSFTGDSSNTGPIHTIISEIRRWIEGNPGDYLRWQLLQTISSSDAFNPLPRRLRLLHRPLRPPQEELDPVAGGPAKSPTTPATPADLARGTPFTPSSLRAEGGPMATPATTSAGTSYKSAPSPMLSILFLAACQPPHIPRHLRRSAKTREMAKKAFQVGLELVVMTIVLSGLASAQSGCTTAIISLAPCLSYITGNSSAPSSSCCSQLASVVKSEPACLCSVLNGGASSFGITVNQTRALAMPAACKVQTPPVSECNCRRHSDPTPFPFSVLSR